MALDFQLQRNDIWNVYLDCVIKANAGPNSNRDGIIKVRKLFFRACGQKIKAKTVLTFFKKWKQFEETHGNKEGIELVKQKARQYAQAQKSHGALKAP